MKYQESLKYIEWNENITSKFGVRSESNAYREIYSIKWKRRKKINNLGFHLSTLEKEVQFKPKVKQQEKKLEKK